MNELKPCPFCGVQPEIFVENGLYTVDCANGECNVTVGTRKCKTQKQAIDIWNSRFYDFGVEVSHND